MRKFMLAALAALAVAVSAFAQAGDWNAIIADYSKVTDELIAATKKLQTGDQAAAQQLQALTPKYQELSQKIAAAAGTQLTPEQLKKFQDISAKYQQLQTGAAPAAAPGMPAMPKMP